MFSLPGPGDDMDSWRRRNGGGVHRFNGPVKIYVESFGHNNHYICLVSLARSVHFIK